MSELGQLKNTNIYRPLHLYKHIERVKDILILRIDAPLFFANIGAVEDWVHRQVIQAEEASQRHFSLILDLGPVTHIDYNALHILLKLIDWAKAHDLLLLFVNPSTLVTAMFHRGGLTTMIGADAFHVNVHSAVLFAKSRLASKTVENDDGLESKVWHSVQPVVPDPQPTGRISAKEADEKADDEFPVLVHERDVERGGEGAGVGGGEGSGDHSPTATGATGSGSPRISLNDHQ